MNHWQLEWTHGRGFVEALGGMLGPVHFRLGDGGREVQPFAVFPWADEPLPPGQQALTGLMSRGRGEWPCVPFGLCPDPEALGWEHGIHGNGSHGLWQRLDDGSDPALIRLGFSAESPESPIESLTREVRGIAGRPEIECRLLVRVRRPCELPIGLHPTLRLPAAPGALRLAPGRFRFGRTLPFELEPGADRVAPGEFFEQLHAVPQRGGGTVDLSALPLDGRNESLLMLCGSDGRFSAANTAENYVVELQWDAEVLPSCLLWISNAGRSLWPWSGRHYALGVEPVCAFFDAGVTASCAANAISERGVRTSLKLEPGQPLDIRLRVALREGDR